MSSTVSAALRILIRPFASTVLMTAAVAAGVHGQPVRTEPAGAPTRFTSRRPVDAVELEAWLDGFMAVHLRTHQVAGATVAVVRDGTLFFSKGYGWADVEGRISVDPATTLFRIGSVSKLFTWTAVMQLRDEGLLDLDADVGTYLDFEIPERFPGPITLRHLLTHTPGLEDRAFGLFGPPSGLPRGTWLRENLPARVRPPGLLPAYSNYGSALAGYIVERVSGLAWEEYVEERILGPLGMASATGRQPLPDQLAGSMSRGYRVEGGDLVAQPFEWIEMAPAGSISASANAMANFMLAHLGSAPNGRPSVLADTTRREMHARAFAVDARVNGMALGFYEKSSHGVRVVGHSGGTQWFFTDLALLVDEGVGLFISTNTAGGGTVLASQFLGAFLDRYHPAPGFVAPPPAPGWSERARAYAGTYRSLRRSYTTFEKAIGPLFDTMVRTVGPGEIVLRAPELTERFREVEPGYFRSASGALEAVFTDGGRGGNAHLLLSATPPVISEKLGPWEGSGLHATLAVGAMLILLSAPALSVVRWFLRRDAEVARPEPGPERAARRAAVGFAVLNLGFVAVVGISLGRDGFMNGEAQGALRAALVLPLASLPLGLVVVGSALAALRGRYWSVWGRAHYVLVACAALVVVAQLAYWNLLGWRF